MAVSGVNYSSITDPATSGTSKKKINNELGKDDFLQLLVTQLQHQDPLAPNDSKAILEQIKPGMTRNQVRDILGSPLLTSVFHADRWDYVFTFQRQGLPLQQRKLALFFKGDVLERVESDALPSEAEFVSSLDVRRATDKPPVLQATEEQLKAFQARNAAPAPAATPAPVGTAPVAYPPLETTGASR